MSVFAYVCLKVAIHMNVYVCFIVRGIRPCAEILNTEIYFGECYADRKGEQNTRDGEGKRKGERMREKEI